MILDLISRKSIKSLDLNCSQTFVNEVIGCCLDQSLLNQGDIGKEAKEVAKLYLSNLVARAYSDSAGISSARHNYLKLSLKDDNATN